MSLFSKLFGGGSEPKQAEPTEHNGFQIFPVPQKETQGYRIAARIEKDGKSHLMIRADTYSSQETAQDASVAKAKQVIDQMGERIFS